MARPAPTAAQAPRPHTAPDLTDPAQWAVLVNPSSFRMSVSGRTDRLERLCASRNIACYRVDGPESIARVLDSLAVAMPRRLVVAAGDGTVHATADWLARRPGQRLPELLVLSGGRTNFVARDLGTRTSPVNLFRRVLDSGNTRAQVRRTLHLAHSAFGDAHAFFVAGGLLDHVIRDVHDWRCRGTGWFRQGVLGTQAGLVRLGLRRLGGRGRYRPPDVAIEAAGLGSLQGPAGIMLISTLEHAEGGLCPYADRGRGGLRITAVRHRARGFWRNLPGLYRGRLDPRMDIDAGYLSGRCESLEIRGLPGIVIDGQPWDLAPDNAVLRIRPGPELRFLQP